MTGETRAQSAYRRLHDDIAGGRIPAESVLSERALAEHLGVSRTPLRTALSQLEGRGIVDRLGNGAILVRSVTVEQLMEIVKTRQLLESAATARAAGHPPTADLAAARDAMARIAGGAPATFDSFWAMDERFHLAVARAARLTLLPDILSELRAVARRCSLTRDYASFVDQSREHVEIAARIAEGDAEGARAAMWLHFDRARARLLETFAGG